VKASDKNETLVNSPGFFMWIKPNTSMGFPRLQNLQVNMNYICNNHHHIHDPLFNPPTCKGIHCAAMFKQFTELAPHMIFLDPETDFGDIVFTKMASNIHCHLKPSDMGSRLTRLNDHLVLKIPMHWMRKLPTKDLNTHQIIKINRHLENIFERDFCDVVSRAHTIFGVDRQTAIECFCNNHGIQLEIDITFEALKKMEYRNRSGKCQAHDPQKNCAGIVLQNKSCIKRKPAPLCRFLLNLLDRYHHTNIFVVLYLTAHHGCNLAAWTIIISICLFRIYSVQPSIILVCAGSFFLNMQTF
jgi:hypothetical protein